MSITYINTGTSPNKGDGDSLRSAFIKINQSFSYINEYLNTSTTDNLTILDQSIYGTVPNRNIEILPSGTGTVVIPTIETNELAITTSTEETVAFIGLVEYGELVDYSFIPGTFISTGTYDIPYSIPAPYGVSTLGGDVEVINKIQVGDVLTSVDTRSYPVVGRGTSAFYNYVVVDLTNYQPAPTPEQFSEVHITRPTTRTFTKITSKPDTGIILDADSTELQIRGSVVPFETATETHLGLPDRRWSDLWVGLGSVHLLDRTYYRDLKLSAKNGNFTVGNSGIEVGNLIFKDNRIETTTSSIRFLIGTSTEVMSVTESGITLSSGTSITFGDGTVQSTAGSGGGGSTGDVTFSGVKVIGAGTASGDGLGYSTLELVPDNNLYSNNQYLIIDPTAPSHIHIRAGGTQDNSNADLFLGGEKNYVRVNDFNGIRLQNETQNENFYYYQDPTFTSGSWYEENGSFYLEFTTTDQTMVNWFWEFSNNALNRIVVNQNDTLQYGGSASNLVNDTYRVQVTTGPVSSPEVVNVIEFQIFTLQTNSITLENNDFRVDVFDDIRMFGRDIFRLANYSIDEPIEITTDYNDNSYTWSFNPDGTLRFPDNTIQTTAFTGVTSTDTLDSVANRGATTTNAITVGNLITSDITGKYSSGIGTNLSGIRPPDGAGANLGYVWVPDVAELSSLGDITGWTMTNSDGIFSTTIVQMRYDLGASWAIQTADPLIYTGTYTFTSPDYAPPEPLPLSVTVGQNTWTFTGPTIAFPDGSVPLTRTNTIPTATTSTGTINQVAFTGTDMYVCIAPDYWIKFTGTTF